MDPKEARKSLSDDLFFIRGASILLVVLIHVVGVEAVHGVRKFFSPDREDLRLVAHVIHSFNMAVMLIGSGVAVSLFGRPDTSFSEFVRKKLNKLIIPMLVWAPAFFLLQELQRARPAVREEWLALLGRVPGAWFPPYAIFWFVHALVACTLLSWLFKRVSAPLGRWDGLVYVALSALLRLGALTWKAHTDNPLVAYLEFILYWNCFFGLGMALQPWLGPLRERLSRLPLALQGLVPVGLFAVLVAWYSTFSAEHYEESRLLNGPLGFLMQLSLALFVRNLTARWGGLAEALRRRLVFAGSISMTIYLFHIYFLSGARTVLVKVWAGAPLAVHLVLGCVVGLLGPVLLYRALQGNRAFRWSIGLPPPPRPEATPAALSPQG
jgi:fucose 4-O-acetylase-like acetyltransferase